MSERTVGGLAAAPGPRPCRRAKPKLTPRQARISQAMYEETGPDGKRRYTVAQIAWSGRPSQAQPRLEIRKERILRRWRATLWHKTYSNGQWR